MLNTFKLFKSEIRNLERLYLTSVFSFDQTAKDMEDTKVSKTGLVRRTIGDEVFQISFGVVRSGLQESFPKMIREIIFVRLISALEVYLIDSIAEVFVYNKNPFLTQEEISFHHSEMLSFNSMADVYSKLLNKITRNLHSGGFGEVTKYYKKTFKIDFNSYEKVIASETYNLSHIREYHVKRHLLVHRLGQTDSEFRKKFDSNMKKISLSEDYFFIAVRSIFAFVKFVDSQLEAIKDEEVSKRSPGTASEYMSTFAMQIIDHDERQFTSGKYQFLVENKIVFLENIWESIKTEDHELRIRVQGERIVVKSFRRSLMKLRREGRIRFKEIDKKFFVRSDKYSAEDIELVRSSLPGRPWKQYIHKEIAQNLGFSNNKTSQIISIILNER